ncbi:putative cytochrome P450 [Emericellopsis atlantica]|uniref:Cytochrome P450 n=1 Tax=Emericellopsis atlantica TaxID=2614577 RepID=A0A9P7ZM19_9HYPO|nr:putative cytochrome P450 [Emericellopsis atlantica]KAG9254166.1 putative cytochrome P450 [Emericellopsis atlantica]
MAYSTSTVASVLVGAVVLLYFISPLGKRSSSTVSLPPDPKPAPVIGNIHQLPKSLQWLHLYHMSKEYGPIMHFSMAGQPLIILSTHKAAHDLLSKRSARYSDRPRMVMAGELYNDQYKLHQKMEAPLLTLKASSTYLPLQDLESQQLLLDEITEMETHGERGVDFHHHHERAMASTIYCLNYGYRLKTGHEQSLQDGKKVQAEFARTGQVGAYLVDSIPALNRLPRFLAPWNKEADELFALECNLHEGNLNKGLSNPGWNFSKYMKASPEGKDMDKTELAFDLGILADAGLDTSTVALDWFIVAWITSGSTWVSKAQKLLDEDVGKDRMPTFDDRPKLAFIDAIASETLRWRPVVVGGVPHFIKTEDSYMDYRIPANSIVLPNAFAICRDESVFGANPNSFDPERWMTGDTTQPPTVDACGLNTTALKDLPQTGFGFGRRICTGRIIARNQLFIQMARMLWAFDVEAGIREDTGQRHVVDDMDCTEGFVTLPKPLRTVMKVRGEHVTRIVKERGTTHNINHAAVLEQMKVQKN